ncbi:helix-turn-helix domain-containing protein [bacterium]|nr:helix-turn-helix domain-containing protein [bacterium]
MNNNGVDTDKREDPITDLISKFINNTNGNIFLTGRAGTGKTTFLRSIVETTHKKAIVAAPTGIAAINAGGVTLHSLFQLPFGAFIPEEVNQSSTSITTSLSTPKSLVSSYKMHKTKRLLLREMELLIIDEVSMLRADLLDAIDVVLRHVRRNKAKPFGGVQVLFIGDLFQLAPVVKEDEWQYLKPYYSGIYFFNAQVLTEFQPLVIELDKIYRQRDARFIQLLNNLRNNEITEEDSQLLNQHYFPDIEKKNEDGYILLTTHNRMVDAKNKKALEKISEPSFFYEAELAGEFNDYMYPIEANLELKKGARVMFVKNDYSGEQRYFNGKIGTISSLKKDEIEVGFLDGQVPVVVEPYTWENKKYTLARETNEIEEKVVGTFKHYPLKLAWAVTIHKSQGLTFDKAIIDVGKAFAPGQIYVALSRLTSLDGLILSSTIPRLGLNPDKSLAVFSQTKQDPSKLAGLFEEESKKYFNSFVLNAFDFSNMIQALSYHTITYNKDVRKSVKQKYKSWAIELLDRSRPLKKTGDAFQNQMQTIISGSKEYEHQLQDRLLAAIGYFEPLMQTLSDKVTSSIKELEGQKGIKAYLNELHDLDNLYYSQLQKMYKAESMIDAIVKNSSFSKETIKKPAMAETRQKEVVKERLKTKKSGKKKAEKGDTKEISYKLYQAGKTIEQIAEERSLVVSTIEGHMAHYVSEGLIDVKQLVEASKLQQIMDKVEELKTSKFQPLKTALGSEFTYGEIRLVVSSMMSKR